MPDTTERFLEVDELMIELLLMFQVLPLPRSLLPGLLAC